MASIPRYVGLAILFLVSAWSTRSFPAANRAPSPPPSAELAKHLTSIAKLTAGSPTILIPEGPFLLGSVRVDDDPYGMGTQFDDTELPQHRVWMDAYEIDRDEISLGEYLVVSIRPQAPPVERSPTSHLARDHSALGHR
jgi:formylglycine-generating enzyme required for sulfatase activity